MRFFSLIILSCASLCAFGQDTETTVHLVSEYDSVRGMYIKSFPDHFFIWPVLKQRRLDFEMQSLSEGKRTLQYQSNKPYSFGVGMYIFDIAFELAFAVPLDEQNKKIYGESHTRDLQLNVLGKKWGIDAYSQRYEGFYVKDNKSDVPVGMPYPQRPDIESRNIGVTGLYIINSKKFSFRSVYNFAEKQLQSNGSWLIFASLNSFKAEGDSAMIGNRYLADFGTDAGMTRVRTTILAVAPGYTYSLIYKGFFLNGTLAIGPAHNWVAYQIENARLINDIDFSVYVAARIALGYNGDRFFGGLAFVNQGRSARFESLRLTNSNSTFRIVFGYRFEEFGFLKKKIWDIPKSLFTR